MGDKILIVDPAGLVGDVNPRDCVSSTMQCLERASLNDLSFIAIIAGSNADAQRFGLPELVGVLKRNFTGGRCRIVAVLPQRHRLLLESFQSHRVDFVSIMDFEKLDHEHIEKELSCLDDQDRPGCQLALVCPFLNYSPVDAETEMAVCGAYRNRMVLGPQRLRSCCETSAHLQCEQYLRPHCDA
jgi:hypothetical protein